MLFLEKDPYGFQNGLKGVRDVVKHQVEALDPPELVDEIDVIQLQAEEVEGLEAVGEPFQQDHQVVLTGGQVQPAVLDEGPESS